MVAEQIKEIVVATTNLGKLYELKKMLQRQVVVRGLEEFDPVEECQENGETFAQNARQKAQYYSRILNCCVLADDSGLVVDALGGRPGVFSARFAGVNGPDRDKANNQKLLELMAEVPTGKRGAHFHCCLCVSSPTEVLIEVEGIWQGIITRQPKGENGFGYDPIFYLPDKKKTVAELLGQEKNEISHRGQALRKLLARLEYRKGCD